MHATACVATGSQSVPWFLLALNKPGSHCKKGLGDCIPRVDLKLKAILQLVSQLLRSSFHLVPQASRDGRQNLGHEATVLARH